MEVRPTLAGRAPVRAEQMRNELEARTHPVDDDVRLAQRTVDRHHVACDCGLGDSGRKPQRLPQLLRIGVVYELWFVGIDEAPYLVRDGQGLYP